MFLVTLSDGKELQNWFIAFVVVVFNGRMALEDTAKVYDELRADLLAAFPLVAKSVLANLVVSEAVSRSVEGKCWQMLQKKVDECTKRTNAEQKRKMEKLKTEFDQKDKVIKAHFGAVQRNFYPFGNYAMSQEVNMFSE